jgi:hypothetical protein
VNYNSGDVAFDQPTSNATGRWWRTGAGTKQHRHAAAGLDW